jgi:hypothetical protein
MSDWQPIVTAPKDGTEVRLRLNLQSVKAYWDDDLRTWVLSRPLHMESIRDPEKWRPV